MVSHARRNIGSTIRERISEHIPEGMEEGRVTRLVERQTARVPSIVFLNLAAASMIASLGIVFLSRRKELANFVGLWAPSFLLFGIYNKIVKVEDELVHEQGHEHEPFQRRVSY